MTLEALTIADMTHSAFEPMIGPLVNLWKIGFGGDHVPSDEAIKEAIRRVDHRHVRVTEENGKSGSCKIGRDQNVDMGAIAKGYIGQKLAEKLKAAGATHALLDLGGNIVAMGKNTRERHGALVCRVPIRAAALLCCGCCERYKRYYFWCIRTQLREERSSLWAYS